MTGVGAAATTVGALLFCQPVLADTLESALAYAYVNNPQLNSQRALVRATDESVPTALAGYRPRAIATASIGTQSLSSTIREIGSTTPVGAPASYFTQSGVNTPHSAGVTVTQNLLNGFQTANRTRQAEAQVFGLHWRPLYQLKLAMRDGLNSFGHYVAAMAGFAFLLPTILLWLMTILLGAAAGWRILRWAGRVFFGWRQPATAANPGT